MADDSDRKMWAGLVWLLGLLGLILVLVTDKKTDKELKFYGVQSTLYSVIFSIIWFGVAIVANIIGLVPYIGWVVGAVLGILSLVLLPVYCLVGLYCIWKAYMLEHIKLPVIGDLAEKWSAGL